MITHTNQVIPQQVRDLEQLAALCKNIDGSCPNFYYYILKQPRALPAALLYYEQDHLVGFLSAYFFYDDAVEISLLVDPAHRNRGIATKLLNAILPLIQLHENHHKLIFSSPAHKNRKRFTRDGYKYLHSEYYMERSHLTPILVNDQRLTYRKATPEDIPQLCALDALCFPQHHGDTVSRFGDLLGNREYQVMLAFYQNNLVGKTHLRWQQNGATLSDIAITPIYQGQGFGTGLITHCINHALSESKPLLNLDVETHNKRALNLYTRLGFTVQNACDFWSIEIDALQPILQKY